MFLTALVMNFIILNLSDKLVISSKPFLKLNVMVDIDISRDDI